MVRRKLLGFFLQYQVNHLTDHPSQIARRMGNGEWPRISRSIWSDKTSQVMGIGAPWKVIRVQPVRRELLGISSEPIKKLPDDHKAAAETKVIVPEESSPKLAIVQNAEPDDANAKRLIEKKMKLQDDVVSVLNESVRGKSVDAIEEEGGLLIAVSDVDKIEWPPVAQHSCARSAASAHSSSS